MFHDQTLIQPHDVRTRNGPHSITAPLNHYRVKGQQRATHQVAELTCVTPVVCTTTVS